MLHNLCQYQNRSIIITSNESLQPVDGAIIQKVVHLSSAAQHQLAGLMEISQ